MVEDTFKFKSGYKIKLSLTENPSQVVYNITTPDNVLIYSKQSGLPAAMGDRTELIQKLKLCIPNNKNAKQELNRVKHKLQKQILALQGEAEQKQIQEQQERDLKVRREVHKAKKILKEIDNPILYVGTIFDWLSAGERINSLLCFISGCSQIILKKPISVIGYGESASGKTHVEKLALGLFPEEYVIIEKQVSPAALFNRSKSDVYFYDGKIVVYGDMGGDNDHDNQQEAFDLMKELQSDGKLSKPVSVKDDSNNWVTEDLVLKGSPCLWYTTVPTDIDNQELSRAIVFTPRTDNQWIFNSRGRALSFKKGKTYSLYEDVVKKSEVVPYMVEHLREVMEDYIVINPYFEIITEILTRSKFYKRDTEKYVSLLDTITALNFYNNEKHTFDDGSKAVITSRDDVQLFLALLEPYRTSIAYNIKPKSAEIYSQLTAVSDETGERYIDTLKFGGTEYLEGITTSEYFEETNTDLSLRSVQRYFSDLRQAGLLKIVGRQGNTNLYDVVEHDFKSTYKDIDYEELIKRVRYELGDEIADIIAADEETPNLDINYKHELIGGTPWQMNM